MHSDQTPTHRGRVRALLAAGIVLISTIGAVGVADATATPAGASGSVTYQGNVTQPGPLSGYFAGTGGGDGWSVALSSSQVFNVPHHQPTLTVACHNQTDGTLCWPASPTKTVTNGATNYATPTGAGLYLDQNTGKLYTYATDTTHNQAGVVCIDTTQPVAATGAQLFCGFTPLSAAGDAPSPAGTNYSGLGAPIQVGNAWYAFNTVGGGGVASGSGSTQNTLLCFSLTTLSACAAQPYTVPLGGLIVNVGPFAIAPPDGAAGHDVFLQENGAIASVPANELACFDTTTNLPCTGSWPVAITAIAGSPFDLLDGSGNTIGVCLPITGDPCYSLTGSPATTPSHMPTAIGATSVYNGPAVVNTAAHRVYVANYSTTAVDCFDFALNQSCANFPRPMASLVSLYTVTPDPYRAGCLWVNADHGPSQIQDFDATSGSTCTPGPIRFSATSAVNANPTCTPTAYSSLQVTSPSHNSYTSGQVLFANAQGTILPIPAVPLNGFGVADLSGVNFGSNRLPQFVVTLNGLTQSPPAVAIRLTWSAPYAQVCTTSGQTVSKSPGYWLSQANGGVFNYGSSIFYGPATPLNPRLPVVGIAALANHAGYWEVATDGGIFSFGYVGFYGSAGNIRLNKPIVGMAATPTGLGYWLVASDGGIFTYGDATFYGSAGNLVLNKPIVGMAATPDGGGYWLVASDGGIFSYGDAQFYGSAGNLVLNKPVVGMTANPNGGGYWLVASDGGIFSYGDAPFYGSTGNLTLVKPIVGMASTFDGAGYWMVASDGGIFAYGDAGFAGSAGGLPLSAPIVGMAS